MPPGTHRRLHGGEAPITQLFIEARGLKTAGVQLHPACAQTVSFLPHGSQKTAAQPSPMAIISHPEKIRHHQFIGPPCGDPAQTDTVLFHAAGKIGRLPKKSGGYTPPGPNKTGPPLAQRPPIVPLKILPIQVKGRQIPRLGHCVPLVVHLLGHRLRNGSCVRG